MNNEVGGATRSELRNAVKELNEVLNLIPQIDEKEGKEKLIEGINESVGLLEPEEDVITDGTLAVLAQLGHFPWGHLQEPAPVDLEQEEPVQEEDRNLEAWGKVILPAETSTTDGNIDLLDMIKSTTKLADLKALVKLNKDIKGFPFLQERRTEYKGLQGLRNLKQDMLAAIEGKEKVPKSPTPKKVREFLTRALKEKKYTQKQLIEITCLKFTSLKKATIAMAVSNGKNPKYSKFETLIKTTDDGILYL